MRVIDFPPEWSGEPLCEAAFFEQDDLQLFGVAVRDGLGREANLWAIIYPGGHRFARVAEVTGWALEERYGGDPPGEEHREKVDRLWREHLEVMTRVNRAAADELKRQQG